MVNSSDTVRCATCGQEFSATGLFCPACGTAKARNLEGDPLLGTRVGDRYLIIDRLGHGASGTIYRGEHVTLRRKVAIKVLHHELSRDDLAMERFRREATTVGEIDNEHILQIFDFGRCADGRLYLAMELLEGETLDAVLERDKRLPVDRAVDILIQLGEALMEAHAVGFIHRDLRPRNIFLAARRGKPNFVKLLDFGLSKLVEKEGEAASTSLGMTFGEPKYMSPEQARGDPVDRRADIYSLGCIAYEMLTGAPPFTGGKVFDILSQHVEAAPAPPSQRRPDVPRWLDAAIMRMLSKRPEDRFITVYRLVEALRQGSQSGQVMADDVARRRETNPPPSVSQAMAKLAQSETVPHERIPEGRAEGRSGKETVRGVPPAAAEELRRLQQAVPRPIDEAAPRARIDEDPTERVPERRPPVDEEDGRATIRREPRRPRPSSGGYASGKASGRPSSSSSGISGAWYADGEELEDGAAADSTARARMAKGRRVGPPSRPLDEDDLYEPPRSKLPFLVGGLVVAALAIALIAYLLRGDGDGDDGQPVAAPPPPVLVDAGVAAEEPSVPVVTPDAGALAQVVDAGAGPAARNTPPRERPPGDGVRRKPDGPKPDGPKPDDPKPDDPKPDGPKDENKAQADFYAKMGQTNLRDGDILGAAGNFKKALELDSGNATAIVGLGEIALEQGSYAAAIGHFKKATKLSRSSRVWTLLGEAYLNSGDRGQAASAFKQALKLDPGNERARNGYEDATGG